MTRGARRSCEVAAATNAASATMAGIASRKAKSGGSVSSQRPISSSRVEGDIGTSIRAADVVRGLSVHSHRNASTVTSVGPSAAASRPNGLIVLSRK